MRQSPYFSAKSLLDIGIGGSRVANLPNKPKKNRNAFGNRNKSLQPATNSSPKVWIPIGKASELMKYNLKLQ